MEISTIGYRGLGRDTGIQKQPSELTVQCQQVLCLTEKLAEAGHRRKHLENPPRLAQTLRSLEEAFRSPH